MEFQFVLGVGQFPQASPTGLSLSIWQCGSLEKTLQGLWLALGLLGFALCVLGRELWGVIGPPLAAQAKDKATTAGH